MLRLCVFVGGLSVVVALAGCSPSEGASDAGADASPPCPATLPVDAGCTAPNQFCMYGEERSTKHRCDCVAPEMKWLCCVVDEGTCFPPANPVIGSLCCAGDVDLPGETISFSCTSCAYTGVETDTTCSTEDRHWRQTTKACVYPDAGWPTPGDAAREASSSDAAAE